MKRITSICLAVLIALSFMPVLGMQEAYANVAQGTNVGTITLDLTQGKVRLSGDKLEAFNNVMQALDKAREINEIEWDGDEIYDLGISGHYDLGRHDCDGYAELYRRDTADYVGEWSMQISLDIQNALKEAGKAYCDNIQIIFPELYDISIEGTQVDKATA